MVERKHILLQIYTLNESEKWTEIVKTFANYDVYYLPSYSKAFQINGDGEPLLFHFENEGLKAINVVMKRDISEIEELKEKIVENTYFDLSTPYGYGGFLFEGDVSERNLKQLDEEYIRYCQKENIISEFVRIHPLNGNVDSLSEIYDVINLGNTVSIKLASEKKVWDNYNSKNRNSVRKAEKSGVEIFWGRSPELFDEFRRIYEATMDKDEANAYYYFSDEFYNSILYDLKNESMIFYAVLEGKIISMAIILYSNNYIHYHLSGSDYSYSSYNPSNLLLTEVANWGANNNFKEFHLGGGVGAKQDSLYKFKKKFNKQDDLEYYIANKIFDEELYEELVKFKKKINSPNFFPKYRG